MPFILKDRVKDTTTTTGTGTLTLSGTAPSGFQAFAAIGNGNSCAYTIVDPATGAWETGIGTYSSSGPTLSRTTVLDSSNSGAAVNFGAGVKDVFVTVPAALVGWTQIATVTPTGTGTVTFSSIPQTYSDLLLVFDAVSHNGGGGHTINLSVSDGSTFSNSPLTLSASTSPSNLLKGSVFIPGYRMNGGPVIGFLSASDSPAIAQATTYGIFVVTGGVKGVRAAWTGGNYDAGTLTLYGR